MRKYRAIHSFLVGVVVSLASLVSLFATFDFKGCHGVVVMWAVQVFLSPALLISWTASRPLSEHRRLANFVL